MSVTLKYLRNYAEWYYTKYFPSCARLRQKLLQKTDDREMINTVMEILSPIFVERNICESQVYAMVGQGKTERYIRSKLRQKLFSSEMIDEILAEFQSSLQTPETYSMPLQALLRKLSSKGYARSRIRSEMAFQYPQAKALIDAMLQDHDDDEARIIFLEKNSARYSGDKLRQKLYEAGFRN